MEDDRIEVAEHDELPQAQRHDRKRQAALGHSAVLGRNGTALLNSRNIRLKKLCETIVDNAVFLVLTTVLTIYALFGDNIRIMATDKSADVAFGWITILCMLVFWFQIVLSCIGKADYFLSFFFWLDVVSTLSLFLDHPDIAEALFSSGSGEEGSAVRAGRAGRAGARAGRVVRIIRLIRIVKLYKAVQEAEAKKRKRQQAKEGINPDDDDWLMDDEDGDGKTVNQESRVGKKLSDMTTRRVIILVLAMLFVIPYLEAGSLDEMPFSGYYGADRVHSTFLDHHNASLHQGVDGRYERERYEDQLLLFIHYHNWYSIDTECEGCDGPYAYDAHVFWVGLGGKQRERLVQSAPIQKTEGELADWVGENLKSSYAFRIDPRLPSSAVRGLSDPWKLSCDSGGGILGVSLTSDAEEGVSCPEDLRYNEQAVLTPSLISKEDYAELRFMAFLDIRPFAKREGLLDTLKILFVIVVLAIGSLMFSKDANLLVLNPLEQMISKVEKIRDNPLFAMKLGDEEFKQEERAKHKSQSLAENKSPLSRLLKLWYRFWRGSESKAEPMETLILEKTIIKIGTLLALGFGEAGANIIGQNMKGAETAGVNAMIMGNRVDCIIGFVSILDFSVLTEVLLGNVMTFVNQVAEIVHGIVNEYHGAANRNNGDSFLMIWRAAGDKNQEAARLAEMSFVSFVKVIAAVHRCPVLAQYRGHPGLLQRIQNYVVQLAFGLHYGWAIEGALGSEFKIEASYVSPNVNIAMRLVDASRQYGVKLLLSEAIMHLMGTELRRLLRLIDRVVVPGSKDPMQIHTIDLHVTPLELECPLKSEGLVWNNRRRFKARQAFEATKQCKKEKQMHVDLQSSKEFMMMRGRYEERFFQVFGMAYHNYIAGEWQIAIDKLTETMLILGVPDGPSAALLDFMHTYEGQCPARWQGYRPLPLRV